MPRHLGSPLGSLQQFVGHGSVDAETQHRLHSHVASPSGFVRFFVMRPQGAAQLDEGGVFYFQLMRIVCPPFCDFTQEVKR